ncbi:MAG: ABC transporter ATP-binding protein [Phycisphaerae bacterium]|nr:ABC transporter ATP-binding protein [Phycisphaerae bacterium]
MTHRLDIRGLTIETQCGEMLVDGIDLLLEAGGVAALVGESGSGKTLTALAVLGLLPPAVRRVRGEIRIDGGDICGMSESERRALRGRDVSMVFQEPMTALDPVMRIDRQMLEARRRRHAARGRTGQSWCVAALEAVGIEEPERVAHSFPHELSGGMRQRVLIAMGLAADPKLILADEPTTALDAINRRDMLETLRGAADRGAGVLLITHDLMSAHGWADTVAVMERGQIVEVGAAQEVLEHPKHPYTKHLLACVPRAGQSGPLGTSTS